MWYNMSFVNNDGTPTDLNYLRFPIMEIHKIFLELLFYIWHAELNTILFKSLVCSNEQIKYEVIDK